MVISYIDRSFYNQFTTNDNYDHVGDHSPHVLVVVVVQRNVLVEVRRNGFDRAQHGQLLRVVVLVGYNMNQPQLWLVDNDLSDSVWWMVVVVGLGHKNRRGLGGMHHNHDNCVMMMLVVEHGHRYGQ